MHYAQRQRVQLARTAISCVDRYVSHAECSPSEFVAALRRKSRVTGNTRRRVKNARIKREVAIMVAPVAAQQIILAAAPQGAAPDTTLGYSG
jgi:hypothetical protein